MSETSNGSIRYQVVYSEFVRNELKKLLARAKKRGLDAQVNAAVKEIDQRLRIFLNSATFWLICRLHQANFGWARSLPWS